MATPRLSVVTLGAGGMGEVFRAHDARLNRDVAIKILPPSVALDPERVARFSREAQTLAALNHPHIAHVYGVEETGSTRALVMELVEGEDLGGAGAIWIYDAELGSFTRLTSRGEFVHSPQWSPDGRRIA